MVAGGYALYGSATMIVLSTGQGVHGFTLDPVRPMFVCVWCWCMFVHNDVLYVCVWWCSTFYVGLCVVVYVCVW